MALITSQSRCALCGEVLKPEPYTATSGVFLPPDDPLAGFCDAPMHWRCYLPWPHRARFARAHVESRLSPHWEVRVHTPTLLLQTQAPYVQAWLYATGTCLGARYDEWPELLHRPYGFKSFHVYELDAWQEERAALARLFPQFEP